LGSECLASLLSVDQGHTPAPQLGGWAAMTCSQAQVTNA
jgi:hypothetical protein